MYIGYNRRMTFSPFSLKHTRYSISLSIILLIVLATPLPVFAEAIPIAGLNTLLRNIYDTIKALALPVNILVLAVLGFQLFSAGDDGNAKARIRNTFIALVIGNAILFGAEPIATALINGSQ